MRNFLLLFLWGVICAATFCGAEPGRPAPVSSSSITVRETYAGPSHIEGNGDVSLGESELAFDVPLNPTTGTVGRLTVRTGILEVDWDRPQGRREEFPLDALLTVSAGYFLAAPVKGAWSAFFRGGLMASGEGDTPVDQAMLYNGLAGAEYAINPKISVQMGILATTRLEDDPLVLPLLGFRWRPTPLWLIATEGAGIKISGPIQRDLNFMLNAGWLTRAWRLDDDQPEPGGILAMEAIRLETGLRWKKGRIWQFEGGLGWEPSQTYRWMDDDGRGAGIETAENAPLVIFSATRRF